MKTLKRMWFIKERLKIAQGIRIRFKTPLIIKGKEIKSCEPDVSIKCNGKLVGVVQVKITPHSSNVILKEMETLKKLREENSELCAILLILDDKSIVPTIKRNLNDFKAKNNWFSFIIMRGEKSKFSRELERKLNLISYM